VPAIRAMVSGHRTIAHVWSVWGRMGGGYTGDV